MPLHRKTDNPQDQSITERSRALELFTDRLEERRLFTQYFNDETPHNQILYFHGDGGSGKSLLLDMLQKDYCHRVSPKNWQRLNAIEKSEEFIGAFSQTEILTQVPCARLDFGARENGDDRPREDWSGLLMLRRELGPQGFQFPTFDFGITLFLHKTRQLSKAKLSSLFPQEESDLAVSLIDLVTEGTYATLAWRVIGLFDKTFLESMTLYRQKRGLDKALVERLTRLDPQAELRDELPHLLARDLNASLQLHKQGDNAPRQVALFFDTHEAFWGHERLDLPTLSYFQQDEWLRRFLGELYNPNHGVTVVIAGREPPRWTESNAGDWRIDQAFIDSQLIGQLNRGDAEDYLRKAGVTDAELITSLINFAEVEPNQAHPLHLGLCADVILEAEKRGEILTSGEFGHLPRAEEKGKELINRLLKYCSPNVRASVEALAAARAFDLPLYLELGRALHLRVSAPDFRELTKFSFIRQEIDQSGKRFRIHDLLRRVLAQIAHTETLTAHHALETYYQTKAETDPMAKIENIYHINQQDWQRGYTEWGKVCEMALQQAKYALCEALIILAPTLIIESHSALSHAFMLSGNYFKAISRHITAEHLLSQATEIADLALQHEPNHSGILINKGLALMGLGELQANLSKHPAALTAYQDSVMAYDRALALEPDRVEALNNKGLALLNLGNLRENLSQHDAALTAYQDSVATYDRVLALAPELVEALNNKGLALLKLGELQANLNQHAAALATYRDSVETIDRALGKTPKSVAALNNKGLALFCIGLLQARLRQHEAALAAYIGSMKTYDQALAFAPESVDTLNYKALTLLRLGQLLTSLNQHDAALAAFRDSVATFEYTLAAAPENIDALNNKGLALQGLGYLLANLGQHEAALTAYQDSVATYDRILALASKSVDVLSNKGLALQGQGEILASMGQHEAALTAYHASVSAYDQTLALAPKSVEVLSNKGAALVSLGELQTHLSHHDAARTAYQDSVATYNHTLALAPKSVEVLSNKGAALTRLGQLETNLGLHDPALATFRESVAIFERTFTLAPERVEALNNKGLALMSLGFLQASLNQHDAAIAAYHDSVATFDHTLVLAPEYVGALYNKGITLQMLARFHFQEGQRDLAQLKLNQAKNSLEKALALDKNNIAIIQEIEKVNGIWKEWFGNLPMS